MFKQLVVLSAIISLGGCATSTMEVVNKVDEQPQISPTLVNTSSMGLKRKIAIARFSNETKHGNSFLLDKKNDRIGKQAMDILSARLTDTGSFLLFERQDLDKIKDESAINKKESAVVGADYLIVGSVSEFGRTTNSEVGFFSRNKKQQAHATVNVRLLDVSTGQVLFSQEGSGIAHDEANRVFGVGETSGYNSSLDDKALSAAISKLVSNLIENLLDKPWSAYILDNQDGQIIISGGKSQGIKSGDEFKVMKRGKSVKNPQTGMTIELPRTEIARLKVVSLAGNGNNEVSICTISSGKLVGPKLTDLVVMEI